MCLSTVSVQVLKFPSFQVFSECLECSGLLWVSLSELCLTKYLIRCKWNRILSIKECLLQRFSKNSILKQNQSTDLKKTFEAVYINLILVRTEFSFLCGHLFKELQASIHDLDITIARETFLWNDFETNNPNVLATSMIYFILCLCFHQKYYFHNWLNEIKYLLFAWRMR